MLGTIRKVWDRVSRWWHGEQPEVLPPDEITLVPIPPPVFEVIFEPEPDTIDEPAIIRPLAVDTQLKRMSVLATRYGRLPFGRRFTTPTADGTIAAPDRLIIGMSYAGIAAGDPPDPPAASTSRYNAYWLWRLRSYSASKNS